MDVLVLVVGAGPAGSALALALAELAPERIPQILVIDAARHPRAKPCGGVVGGQALPLLTQWAVDLSSVPRQPVNRIVVRRGTRQLERPLPTPALVVHRPSFDTALIAAARERGITIREGVRLQGLERQGERFVATVDAPCGREIIRPRVVVGADGGLGPVRRLAGLPAGRRRAWLALVDRPSGPGDPGADALIFHLPSSRAVNGYLWNFPAPRPSGVGTRNIGAFHCPDIRGAAAWPLLHRELARLEGVEEHGLAHAVQRLYEPRLASAAPGLLLVGEALGADPMSGEGIAHALTQGPVAAHEMLSGLWRRDLTFSSWPRPVLQSAGRTLRQAAWLAPWAYGPLHAWLADRLVRAPTVADLAIQRFCGVRSTRGQRRRALRELFWPW